jgi:hypothetical protein
MALAVSFVMNALDKLIPTPRLLEIDRVDISASPADVWEVVRHANLASSPLVQALIGRWTGDFSLRIDRLVSTAERPGFGVLVDNPPHEVAFGAIGKVWEAPIPFVHTSDATEFSAFARPGFAKIACVLRTLPLGKHDCRVEVELRVDATDEESWRRFRHYFRIVGIASHFLRRSMLTSIARQFGTTDAGERERPLDGDELISDAAASDTRGVTIHAQPADIWPWLLEIARPNADDEAGLEVLRNEPDHCLVLGGLYDLSAQSQLPFRRPRPERYWQATWAFILEPLDAKKTRLHIRARAAFAPGGKKLHPTWMRPVHALVETVQLRKLAAAIERSKHEDWREVLAGSGGAALMAGAFLTPLLRGTRNHWGLDAELALRVYPGDGRVIEPRWAWTHAVEVDAPADEVWPWVAQIGADRAGFYSDEWLDNHADTVRAEWQLSIGDDLRLHPQAPPLKIVELEPRRWLVAAAAPDETTRTSSKPWASVSWLLFVEALGPGRCRVVSRYRCDSSEDLATRFSVGPTFLEPIGFALDRRMLMGVRARAERHARLLRNVS